MICLASKTKFALIYNKIKKKCSSGLCHQTDSGRLFFPTLNSILAKPSSTQNQSENDYIQCVGWQRCTEKIKNLRNLSLEEKHTWMVVKMSTDNVQLAESQVLRFHFIFHTEGNEAGTCTQNLNVNYPLTTLTLKYYLYSLYLHLSIGPSCL